MWHERVLIWRAGETSWYIQTPDLDLYEEDFSGGGDGPTKFKIKGKHVQYYLRLTKPVYRFADDPTDGEMRSYIERALDEMGLDTVPMDGHRPQEVKVQNHTVPTSLLLGDLCHGASPAEGVMEAPAPAIEPLLVVLEWNKKLQPLLPAPVGYIWWNMASSTEVFIEAGRGLQGGNHGRAFQLVGQGFGAWTPPASARLAAVIKPVEDVVELPQAEDNVGESASTMLGRSTRSIITPSGRGTRNGSRSPSR